MLLEYLWEIEGTVDKVRRNTLGVCVSASSKKLIVSCISTSLYKLGFFLLRYFSLLLAYLLYGVVDCINKTILSIGVKYHELVHKKVECFKKKFGFIFLIFNMIRSFCSDDMQFWTSLLHGKRRIYQFILQFTDQDMLVSVYTHFYFWTWTLEPKCDRCVHKYGDCYLDVNYIYAKG